MKKVIKLSYCILLILILLKCKEKRDVPSESLYSQIDSLIEAKNYFSAREIYSDKKLNLSKLHQLKAGAFLDNAFNRIDSSVYKIEYIFKNYPNEITDSLKYQLFTLAHVNYSKQYEYKKAKRVIEKVLTNHSHLMEEEEKKDLENTLIIWNALQDQPRQEVYINNGVDLIIIRDKAGLQNLEVNKGTIRSNFVFDTGANLSTITESTARHFGLQVLPEVFDVNSITGTPIKSKIAIAPEFSLGDIIIKNAVFLVFPDNALAFPQINYQINGILGFPVIEALKEIRITKDSRFIVPAEPSFSDNKNLAIDFLTPLIYLKDERGEGTYTFDTGAERTILYNTYFEKNKEELAAQFQENELKLGGAGGEVTKKGLYIQFKPEVDGISLKLDSTMVLKEPLNPDNRYLGNIGQDLIGQFNKMTINFEDMFIKFE